MRGWANFGDRRLPQRFWDKVSPCPISGCWIWTGYMTPSGYGQCHRYGTKRRPTSTHRLSFETLVGSIPGGLEIDHLCKVTCCCNPAHLEAVSPEENIRRSSWGVRRRVTADRNAAKTHCPHGHEYTPENTLVTRRPSKNTSARQCRTCLRAKSLKYYYLSKAKAVAL